MADANLPLPNGFGPIVRTILSGVPSIGSSLATAWSEWDSSRRFARIEATVRHLAFRLGTLTDHFGANVIGDEEMQLLEEVLRRVQEEHRELKRQRFAQLLVGTWTSQRHRPFEERMRHVRALEEFTDVHIDILQFLTEQSEAGVLPSYSAVGDAVDIPIEYRNAELIPILERLARYCQLLWMKVLSGGGFLGFDSVGEWNSSDHIGQ